MKNKDGSLRFCIDYRRLNEVSHKDSYPLPRIYTCLDSMAGARWFSIFDLRADYHQVQIDPTSAEKTTFITRDGTFKFEVMSFGLTGAPATFRRLIDMVMSGLNLEICLVYLGDIIVFSAGVDEHLDRLRAILERLRSARLKLKPSKCRLFQRSVSILGHIVSGVGMATDPWKIKSVAKWPVPACLKDLRSFVDLCGYDRRFVKGFAEIAAPLHKMTGKGVSYQITKLRFSASSKH